MRGPERIESGWWDPQLTVRDYFVAEDEAAARYWIYRERDAEHALVPARAVRLTPVRGSARYPIMRPPDDPADAPELLALLPGYAELHCQNFSFLQGASHPEELAARAAELGYAALAITDECSLAGVVRALLIGACFSCAPRRRRAAGP